MKLKCKTIKQISLVASLAFLTGCSTPSEPKQEDLLASLDKYSYVKAYMRWYIKERMDDNGIVGLSIALVDDQKIVWSEGFGYEDKTKGIKATPQTRYRAGSITKLFTAMATMKLAEEGKLNIDKPFKTYLPEFSVKSRFGSTNGITPRSIMTHHSGLIGDWWDRMFATNPLPYTQLVKVIKDEYVAYPPNMMLSYSNVGVSLLGYAVEKVSGQTYTTYVKHTLLNPLGMKDSDMNMALSGNNASKSYSDGKEVKEYAIGEIPAGALNTTVEDLSYLAMMVNNNGKMHNQTILHRQTLKKMFTIQNKNNIFDVGWNIGLGWFIDDDVLSGKEYVYGHGGGTVAHRSYFAVAPNSKLGVVVLSNSDSSDATEIANKLLQKAWESKLGKKLEIKEKIINETSDFEGIYASFLGKVTITKKGEKYDVTTPSASFLLYKDKYNSYRAKYKLLGFIPIGIDEIEKIRLYTKDINGQHVIIGSIPSGTVIVGARVKPHIIPPVWKNYLGKYNILNNLEPKAFKIKNVLLKIDNEGYLLFEAKMVSGESINYILKPVNDTEAIVEGLGRGMKETIYFRDGMFHYAGLKFKKIAK